MENSAPSPGINNLSGLPNKKIRSSIRRFIDFEAMRPRFEPLKLSRPDRPCTGAVHLN
jgi:hypothetical protein